MLISFKDLLHHRLETGLCYSSARDNLHCEKGTRLPYSGSCGALQEAAVTGLRFGADYYQWLQDKYTEKRQLFLDGLDRIGLSHTVPQGAYYILLDISEFGYKSDLDFCEKLAEYVGVGAVPGSSFFKEPENRYIRFHFAKKNDTLNNALERLADIRKKMPRA